MGISLDVDQREWGHAKAMARAGPQQWLHVWALDHGITFLHTVPLFHCDDPLPGYMEVLESSFIVGKCLIEHDVWNQKHFMVASMAKPSGSKLRVGIVGGNRELSLMRPALRRGTVYCNECDERFDTHVQLQEHKRAIGSHNGSKICNLGECGGVEIDSPS